MTSPYMGTLIPVNRDYSTAWSPRRGFSPTTSQKTSGSTKASTDALLNELGIPESPRSHKNMWKAILVGFLVVAVLALLVLASWTLISIRQGLGNHTGTLNAIHGDVVQIKTLTRQVHGYQEASAEGKTEVDKLLVLAGQEVSALNAKLHVLCDKVGANC